MFKAVCACAIILTNVAIAVSCHDRYSESSANTLRNYLYNDERFCRYRDHEPLYPLSIWKMVSGGYCYVYTQPERFVNRLPVFGCQYSIDGITYTIPCTRVNDVTIFFDYTNENYVNIISTSFRTQDFVRKWKQCSEAAFICCTDFLNEENLHPTEEHPCPALWDGWSCYPSAAAGTITRVRCPSFIYTSGEIVCLMDSERECHKNGTWNHETNYLVCASAPVYRRRHTFHVNALAVSTALSFPAVIIFLIYPKLHILRMALHRNLIISIIIKNILTIMSKTLVILDSLRPTNETNNVLNDSGAACKILAYLESVSKNLVFTCMLMVGIYLHKSIARVFSPDPNIYFMYGSVIVLAFIPSTIWAILMATSNSEHCWMVDPASWYQWISDGFKLLILVINTILLFDILRVILSKRSGENKKQNKSALRVAIVLIPLFGIPLLFTSQRSLFNTDTCLAGDIYFMSTYLIEAAQGVLVALLFCYLNKDVQREIKNSYRKLRLHLESRYGINYVANLNRRRTTAFTNVRTSVDEFQQRNTPSAFTDNNIVVKDKVEDWLNDKSNATKC